jgi:hypothetical protein
MLISYTHQFIFVHVDRTAGTSIQDALAPDRQRTSDEVWRRRLIWLGGANAVGGPVDMDENELVSVRNQHQGSVFSGYYCGWPRFQLARRSGSSGAAALRKA